MTKKKKKPKSKINLKKDVPASDWNWGAGGSNTIVLGRGYEPNGKKKKDF